MIVVNRFIIVLCVQLMIASAASQTGATTLSQPVINVVDTNPDPGIFEAALSSDEQDVIIDGTTVHAMIFKDDNRVYPAVEPNGIPIPQMVVNVGDEVIVQLTNNIDPGCAALSCNSSIHFHGVEMDNDSDGTGVTQNRLTAGQTYTYRFYPPRPGVFWFHSHMKPGPQVFTGMYGVFIVKDPNEATLQGDSKIPSEANTHTVVLSDIEYDADGDVGYVDAGQAIPWATLQEECATLGTNCQTVSNGDTVLVNGQKPTASTPMITAKSGAGIRLRLINSATNRYFRLQLVNNGTDNNLYRIGGEGGFLEKVRLEGGTLGTWDTKYAKGEIVLGASGRTDVVVVPTGNDGDIISLTAPGYARGGSPGNEDPAGDLLYIKIDNNLPDTPFAIAEGNDVLGTGGVEDLKSAVISDFYTNPPPIFDSNPGAGAGSANSIIRLQVPPNIDDVLGQFEDSGPDYKLVPYQNATRYAVTGDTLEFAISNYNTSQHHPFHHHGFSFQPVRVIDHGDPADPSDNTILYEFDYPEFVDVIDVFNGQSVVVRMRLDDRPRITDNRPEAGAPAPNQRFDTGGAKGRWVFHCHLFLHASLGMISELVVVDPIVNNDVVMNLPGSGVKILLNDNTSSTVLHADTAEAIATADVDNNGMSDVIVSFLAGSGPGGTGGTYISRNQGVLVLLDSKIAEQIAVGNFDGFGGDDLMLDFGTDGLWYSLNEGVVTQLTAESPMAMAVGDTDNSGQDDVVLSLNSAGTVLIKNFNVQEVLDSTPANVLELGDTDGNGEDDIFASFSVGNGPGATGGLSVSANQGALFSLTPLETLNMASGDYGNNGQDDFLLDFGVANELVILFNGASVSSLGSQSVVAMTSGDVDGNGEDDMILSITGAGTLVLKNLTTEETLDPAEALDLATGNVDGQ
jgi:FtsP/CotA-like multicopper oxidase with cupredoxin domain